MLTLSLSAFDPTRTSAIRFCCAAQHSSRLTMWDMVRCALPGGLVVRRRDFITLLGSAAAWPLAARAQGADDLPRVAILSPDPAPTDRLASFLGRLRELGYVDGRNIRLGIRFAGSRYDRLPALA